MAKTRAQKKEIIQNLKDKIKQSKSVIFTNFKGLGVKENEDLRNKLKAENSEYFVAKKTLIDLAFKDLKIDGFAPKELEGQVAAVFGYEDEVVPAKIVDEFKKGNKDKIEFLGGILDLSAEKAEGKFLGIQEVEELAKLPSKPELYAKVVGSINAPVSGLVNVLAGNLRGLVYTLNAIKDNKS